MIIWHKFLSILFFASILIKLIYLSHLKNGTKELVYLFKLYRVPSMLGLFLSAAAHSQVNFIFADSTIILCVL